MGVDSFSFFFFFWVEGGFLRAPRRSPAELRVVRLIASLEGLGQVITHWAV